MPAMNSKGSEQPKFFEDKPSTTTATTTIVGHYMTDLTIQGLKFSHILHPDLEINTLSEHR